MEHFRRAAAAVVCAAALTAMAIMPAGAGAAAGSLTDDSAADFQAGTTGSSTQVVASGAVRLARAREDFDGSALPQGLSSNPWSSGGSATVADGDLTVDGARVDVDPLAPAGRTLEFRAAFSATPFENVGYGETFEDVPWASFSTGGGVLPVGLYTRTAVAGAASSVDVPIPDVDPTIMHTYRIEWGDTEVRYFVDGALVDSEPAAITSALRPMVSDYDAGNGGVTVDWLTHDGYQSPGTFESRVLDAGDARAAWGLLTLEADGSVTFATRSGNTPTPDASWSDFAAVGPGGEIVSPRGRYLQYRATLETPDSATTPTVNRVDASFDVDTVAPTAAIDGVDVSGTAAIVHFSSADGDVARFECKLDGGAFVTCTNPVQLTDLAQGPHTIAVRAIDVAGNTGTAASRDFTIDTIAPSTTIERVDLSGSSVTIAFSSPDADVARFECRLDSGEYTTCTSPKRLSGLAVGAHTIAVRAVDTTGRTGSATSRRFSVQAPATTPPGPTTQPGPTTGSPQPPAPPAAPAGPTAAPTIRLAPAKARVSKTGVVKLAIACPDAGCSVTVRLTRGGVTVARKTASIGAGESRALRLRLNRAARRKLARMRRMKVTAVVTARDAAGNTTRRAKLVTLIAPTR